ncbi:4088_t:CDS:2 [Acaulospora colombiana]|uniref:4088_t:CDS:1 n=1 Tax=Acaulospora colombiana TaxID=27376 RepID=A0ACA9M0G7_9GLOM|nr:4088_t:CDS:2 [Acaulospora colombiana]
MSSSSHVSVLVSQNEKEIDEDLKESEELMDKNDRESDEEEPQDVPERLESGESGQEREGLLSGHPADEELQENPDKNGLQAKYLIPSFPSVTFPNHYTIVTGLYPESHGIVGNEFYDPDLKDYFYYKDPRKSLDSKWWGGEPIWVTAAKQGQKSGVSQWVGSSSVIKGLMPTYHYPFDPNVTMDEQVSRVMNWLDLPLNERPTFISAYVSDVDYIGHRKGPDSVELDEALKLTDNMTRNLLEGLSQRNLMNIVNFIIVSDHGMVASNDSNLIYLDEIFNISKVHPLVGYPLVDIRPYDDLDTNEIYLKLKNASLNKPWECFLRDEIPERYHFRKSHRIPPILCIPLMPWTFASREFTTNHTTFGIHGYDNLEPMMRGIFLAAGPVFRKVAGNTKTNVVNGFYNIEVYNIIAKILELMPAENNGTVGGILWK